MAANQTDLVGTVWRDDMWLSNYPLNYHTAVDYFACSPFWDPGCNNVRARLEQRALTYELLYSASHLCINATLLTCSVHKQGTAGHRIHS